MSDKGTGRDPSAARPPSKTIRSGGHETIDLASGSFLSLKSVSPRGRGVSNSTKIRGYDNLCNLTADASAAARRGDKEWVPSGPFGYFRYTVARFDGCDGARGGGAHKCLRSNQSEPATNRECSDTFGFRVYRQSTSEYLELAQDQDGVPASWLALKTLNRHGNFRMCRRRICLSRQPKHD